jgi:hypothetical protein
MTFFVIVEGARSTNISVFTRLPSLVIYSKLLRINCLADLIPTGRPSWQFGYRVALEKGVPGPKVVTKQRREKLNA